ncbi:MAG: hypothetical protein ABIT16_13955, partial [Croceibacterium sp.]
MRYRITGLGLGLGLGLAAIAAAAAAQDAAPVWQYFEPEGAPMQAGTISADGAQLILKCDKPGRRSVYSVVVTKARLVPPSSAPFTLDTEVRFDSAAPFSDRWRFYDFSAVAINQGRSTALTRFLRGLVDASTLRLR